MLNHEFKIKPNGNAKVSLWKKACSYVGNMVVDRYNVCITEISNKKIITDKHRKFIISITMSDSKTNNYKISQVNIDKEELIQIRNSIDLILNS